MLSIQARVDLEAIAMKRYSTFPKLQHYWNLTIRLFSVISGHSLVGLNPLRRCCSQGIRAKNSTRTIGRLKGLIPFPRGISSKVNVIVRRKLELKYYNVIVQLPTILRRTPSQRRKKNILNSRIWYLYPKLDAPKKKKKKNPTPKLLKSVVLYRFFCQALLWYF